MGLAALTTPEPEPAPYRSKLTLLRKILYILHILQSYKSIRRVVKWYDFDEKMTSVNLYVMSIALH